MPVRWTLSTLVAGLASASLRAASADLADETALAERFAPVVRLVEQAAECAGEPTADGRRSLRESTVRSAGVKPRISSGP